VKRVFHGGQAGVVVPLSGSLIQDTPGARFRSRRAAPAGRNCLFRPRALGDAGQQTEIGSGWL